jgi:SAM-dependent methyltransferase
VPFRATFDCLWCGATHATRSSDDVEGWAQLCPACIGRAGDNGFLRSRLRAGLDERGRARTEVDAGPRALAQPAIETQAATASGPPPEPARPTAGRRALDPEMVAYYEARAPEYDDWYLRRGRYRHGPIDDMAWAADLDRATLWLDALPWHGEIVELAAGTGWWSPLLASRGELWCYDAAAAPLDLARQRLLAHGLRAHLHVRDAWAPPDRPVDGVFTGFWLSHVDRAELLESLAIVRRWLRPGGLFAFVDSRPDPASGTIDRLPTPAPDRSRRRLSDGREYTIPKVHHLPTELEAALRAAGFHDVSIETTARFFVLGRATA